MSRNESVDAIRKKIDQIDAKIVRLLNDRASLALRIGHTKNRTSEEVYVPGREKEILQRVVQLSHGPLSEQAVRSIYREVISACRSLEGPLTISFFGAEASYSHLAAREKFGSAAKLRPTASIAEVFQEVSQGRAKFGVVPIENSTEGVVAHTLDLLVDSELKICAEVYLDIHHCLLTRDGHAGDIRRIVSHPQALAQCRRWLSHHFPRAELEDVVSTAHAAMLASTDSTVGAISSVMAKDVYELQVVAANIEDQSNNITRFLVLGTKDSLPTGADKTSLAFSTKDKPGVLYRLLQPFASSRINLSKIESRPLKNKPWEYVFFIDLNGHREDKRVKTAINEIERNCHFVKVLGSYPSGA